MPPHLPSYPAHASSPYTPTNPTTRPLHYPLTTPLHCPYRPLPAYEPPPPPPPPPKAYEAIQQYAGEAGVIASVDRLYQAAMMLQAEGHTPLLSRAQAAQMLGAPPSRQNAHKSLDMGATTVLAIAGVATVGIGALVHRARRWEPPPLSHPLFLSLKPAFACHSTPCFYRTPHARLVF